MIATQLRPPPAAVGRGGSAASGAPAEGCTGALVASGDGGFVAVLNGRFAPAPADVALAGDPRPHAAAPLAGELEEAEADGSSIAIDAAMLLVVAPAAAVVVPHSSAAAQAGAAGTGGAASVAAPVLPPTGRPAAIPAEPATPSSAQAAGAAVPASAEGRPSAPPAAALTLTLAPMADAAIAGDGGGPAPAPSPSPALAGAGEEAPAPAGPAVGGPPPAAHGATPAARPAGDLSAAFGARGQGPLTSPHELARELGDRIRMGVREGGRELLVQLRPAELGHLTIRLTSHDGVLTAQILADRPDAARLLSQCLAQLGEALGDSGYSLESLDVAYDGGDPREAADSNGSEAAGVRRPSDGADEQRAAGAAADGGVTSTSAGASSRLNLLA